MKRIAAGKIRIALMGKYRMLGYGRSVGWQSEPDMAEAQNDAGFSSRLAATFQAQIIMPLMGRAGLAPAEVRALIHTLRDRLDTLETLLSPDDMHPGAAAQMNGSAAGAHSHSASPELDDIGRNQRSRVRELALLATLEAEHNALPLQQITRALKDAGFEDTSAAIVSQLHRLKKLGVIAQPANGMYGLTPDGVLHVRDLRKNFGHLARR
jgi:hypothetical protein